MNQYETLCMGCMKDNYGNIICPHCGMESDETQEKPFLALRTILNTRYLVGKQIEKNGEGITYIGWDKTQDAPVFIREFYPDTIAARGEENDAVQVLAGCEQDYSACMESFLSLWRDLAKMRDLSAMITVYDIFEENETAYAVYEYFEAKTLREYLLDFETGYLSWEQARSLFMPVLSTLHALHNQQIIHRGISPTTLMVEPGGKMKLTGFSIKEARSARDTLTAQMFPGYAAIEQYGFDGQQGPWTDIYAFGATLYRTLVGNAPMEATERVTNDKLMVPAKLAEELPAYVINALANSLQIMPTDRIQDVEQLREELSASPRVSMSYDEELEEDTEVDAEQPVAGKKKKLDKKTILIFSIVGAVLLLALTLFLIFFRPGGDDTDDPTGDTQQTGQVDEDLVDVPNLVGQSYESVSSNPIWAQNFRFEVDYKFSNTYDAGIIMKQSVAKYEKVSTGTVIRLEVSKGTEKVVLPELEGLDVKTAKQRLKDLGFRYEITTQLNDGSHEEDTVAAVVPTPGEAYEKGKTIILQVWGKAPTTEPDTTEDVAGDNGGGFPWNVGD